MKFSLHRVLIFALLSLTTARRLGEESSATGSDVSSSSSVDTDVAPKDDGATSPHDLSIIRSFDEEGQHQEQEKPKVDVSTIKVWVDNKNDEEDSERRNLAQDEFDKEQAKIKEFSDFFGSVQVKLAKPLTDEEDLVANDQQNRDLQWQKSAQVVLLIDGSDELNSQDFNVQRRALIQAIQDPNVVPRDGTIELAVIQYAETQAVVVDLIVIEDEIDVDSVVFDLNGMSRLPSQNRGRADAGDAVVFVDEFVFQPFSKRKWRQIISMTVSRPTPTQDQVALAAAVKSAKRAKYKLDSFSVIVLSGVTQASDEQFRQFYADLLFDGQLVFAEDQDDLALWFATTGFGYNTSGGNPNPVSNLAPVTTINRPSGNGNTYTIGTTITFEATATDPEDGNVDNSIQWFLEGNPLVLVGTNQPATGPSIFFNTAGYTQGPLTFSARATDSRGLVGQFDSVSVVLRSGGGGNTPPVISIVRPTPTEFPRRGSYMAIPESDQFRLEAEAFDEEDGFLKGAAVSWRLNGQDYFTGTSTRVKAGDLPVGRHTITAQAVDSHIRLSNVATVRIEITSGGAGPVVIPQPPATNRAPVTTITNPAKSGKKYTVGKKLRLEATAYDIEDGIITNTIQWFLFEDALVDTNNNYLLGPAIVVDTEDWQPGSYTFYAQATDKEGLTGGADVVTIILERAPNQNTNGRPEVSITRPNSGEFPTQGQVIVIPQNEAFRLEADAYDPEDMVLRGSSVIWELNGASFFKGSSKLVKARELPVGTHVVEVQAVDSQGLRSNVDRITIQIQRVLVDPRDIPSIEMLSPSDFSSYRPNDLIYLSADARDSENQVLPDANVIWEFFNGVAYVPFAYDNNFRIRAEEVAAAAGGFGLILISVQTEDLEGRLSPRDTVDILIDTANSAPRVEISRPFYGSLWRTDQLIQLSADAEDDEEGLLDGARVQWTTNRVPGFVLARGRNPSRLDAGSLDLGRHVLTVTATDRFGATDSDSTTIRITEGPDVVVLAPAIGTSYYQNDEMVLQTVARTRSGQAIADNRVEWFFVEAGRDYDQARSLGRGKSIRVRADGVGDFEVFAVATEGPFNLMGIDSSLIKIRPDNRPGQSRTIFDP